MNFFFFIYYKICGLLLNAVSDFSFLFMFSEIMAFLKVSAFVSANIYHTSQNVLISLSFFFVVVVKTDGKNGLI